MAVMLRRLPALAGLAALAAIGAELAGHRAFTRLVRQDVQALRARAAPGRAGVVTEEMLADLPGPVRRYLRYTGVVGKPFPGTIRLHPAGPDAARAGPAVGIPGRRGTLLGAAARIRVGRHGAPGPAAARRHRPCQPQGAGQHDPPVHHLAQQPRLRRTAPPHRRQGKRSFMRL